MPAAYASHKVKCHAFTQQGFTQDTQYMENAFQSWSWDHFATWFMVPEGGTATECRVGKASEGAGGNDVDFHLGRISLKPPEPLSGMTAKLSFITIQKADSLPASISCSIKGF